MDNGSVFASTNLSALVQMPHTSWAEAPGAFYNPKTNCYYLFYSRNVWDKSTYNICYRKLSACNGKRFSDMALATWNNSAVSDEHVLLKSDRLYGNNALARSFGAARVFPMRGTGVASDVLEYYIIFHAKFDYAVSEGCQGQTFAQCPNTYQFSNSACEVNSPARTCFIKELTFLPNGDIEELHFGADDVNIPLDHNDVRQFVVPVGRVGMPPAKWGCHEDFNLDGTLSVVDLLDFLAGWFENRMECDWDCGGSVEPGDIFVYLNAWFAGCP